ncbi:MAG: type I methionyl aminopeptidase [Tissierellia bacterium]|nr:type I methionyl aminopeptidase [Tissierellia bacterium]
MIKLKTKEQIQKMREASEILCKTHLALQKILKPGLSTLQLDKFAHDFMIYKKAKPAQLGYMGFPYSLCTSVNDEICHGFPTDYRLKEGDLISIDNVVEYNGGLADSCWSYKIGEVSEEVSKLYDVTYNSLMRAIEVSQVGYRLGDIGHAIQEYVEENGFSVVREFTGHGIGDEMHEDPQVLHYGKAGRGQRLEENMVFTIEPMVNIGHWKSKLDDNGWTARTIDNKVSCQFEHQIVITNSKPEILTDQNKYSLSKEDNEFISNYKL